MQPPQGQPPVQYGLPMNNAPLPVILNTQPQSSVRDKYKVKSVKILSILQIVLGSLAIIFQIWNITNRSTLSIVGAGIWTGVLFIIAGSLGVHSSKTRTTCAIASFLVMSIIASVFTIALLVCSAISMAIGSEHREDNQWQLNNYADSDDYYGGPKPYYLQTSFLEQSIRRIDMIIAISAILLLISLTEAVVAIVSSSYACHGLCCSKSQQGNVLIQGQVQYIPGPNGQTQMVIIPMPNQANLMTANPPYQHTTPVGGFQTQPLAAPQGEMPGGHGMPHGMPQLHQEQAAAPPQPPTYSRQTTPPPEYEEKEKPQSETNALEL